jgi:hypothetical protein
MAIWCISRTWPQSSDFNSIPTLKRDLCYFFNWVLGESMIEFSSISWCHWRVFLFWASQSRFKFSIIKPSFASEYFLKTLPRLNERGELSFSIWFRWIPLVSRMHLVSLCFVWSADQEGWAGWWWREMMRWAFFFINVIEKNSSPLDSKY